MDTNHVDLSVKDRNVYKCKKGEPVEIKMRIEAATNKSDALKQFSAITKALTMSYGLALRRAVEAPTGQMQTIAFEDAGAIMAAQGNLCSIELFIHNLDPKRK